MTAPRREEGATRSGGRRLLRLTTSVVGLALAAGWLLFLLPASLGGSAAYVIVSGTSMQPTLHTGDLVVLREQSAYEVGDIVSYRVPEGDPGAGSTVIHRVVGGDAESGYVLKGDNRDTVDMWRPRPDDVAGRQLVAAPYAGRVLAFLRSTLGLALLGGLLTTGLVARALAEDEDDADGEDDEDDADGEDQDGDKQLGERDEPVHAPAAEPVRSATVTAGTAARSLGAGARVRVVAALLALGVVLSLGGGSGVSAAASLPVTARKLEVYRPTNLPCANPGQQTLTADRDTWVNQAAATTNYSTSNVLTVRSQNAQNARLLLGFPLPTTPANCTVTAATLRITSTTAAAGRTIRVSRVTSAWTNTTVSWNTQPTTTNTNGVTATSGTGLRTWTVTTMVRDMYTNGTNSVQLRDNAENNGSAVDQIYQSRENAGAKPELLITFG